jgi:uncharacterized protein
MMMPVTDDIISEMVQAIVKEIDPEMVILFGSRVSGRAYPDSDVDLLVVEKEPFGPERSRRQELLRIRRAVSPFRTAKDILVYSADEVDHWRNSLNHILGEIMREGKRLYERS